VSTGFWDHRCHKLSVNSYLSDLQAKLARLERNPDEAANATEARQTTRHDRGREDEIESRGGQEESEDRASPDDTRESSPRSRHNAEDANLTNPLVESSKFLSSSSGRSCEYNTVHLSHWYCSANALVLR